MMEKRRTTFALGIIIYNLVTGVAPFEKATESDVVYKAISKGKWKTLWTLWEKYFTFSSSCKQLLSNLLTSDEDARYTIKQIKESEWYNKATSASHSEVIAEMAKRKSLRS